jgi:hypothetical protein
MGHELGDGQYVFDRHPDLVLFCLATGSQAPCYKSDSELSGLGEFHDDYQIVTFEVPRPSQMKSQIWVRREGRVGIRRQGCHVVVPAYLGSQKGTSVAQADLQGHIGSVATIDAPIVIANPGVGATALRVEVEPPTAPVVVSVDGPQVQTGRPADLRITSPWSSVSVAPADRDDVWIESVTFDGCGP